LYEEGWGVPKDRARAKALYEQAVGTKPIASAGEAYYALGMAYEQGRGVPRDPARALAVYQQAASLDHEGAKTKLRQLMR
jgi:hypothetical protein